MKKRIKFAKKFKIENKPKVQRANNRKNIKITFLTVPDTSCTFDDATSLNFQPISAARPPNLDAPIEKADRD